MNRTDERTTKETDRQTEQPKDSERWGIFSLQ